MNNTAKAFILYFSLLSIGFLTLLIKFLRGAFYVISSIVVVFTVYVVDKENLDDLGLKFGKNDLKYFAFATVLGSIAVAGYVCLGLLSQLLLLEFNDLSETFFAYILAGLLASFAISLVEELIFRGYIFSRLASEHSILFSSTMSSLMFSLFHVFRIYAGTIFLASPIESFLFFLNMFLGGLILSNLYVGSKGLSAPIGFHFAWNFLGYYFFGLGFKEGYFKSKILYPTEISGFETGLLTTVVFLLVLVFSQKYFLRD